MCIQGMACIVSVQLKVINIAYSSFFFIALQTVEPSKGEPLPLVSVCAVCVCAYTYVRRTRYPVHT